MKDSKQQKKGGSGGKRSSFIQRMSRSSVAKGEETPFVSRKPQGVVQPKLSVSQPGDPLEREADRVAEQVMRKPQPGEDTPMISRMHAGSSPVSRKAGPREEKEDGPTSSETIVQRRAGCKEDLQTKRATDKPPLASRQLADRLEGRKRQGAPLPAGLKTKMEGRFGRDFSDVRVHIDEEAVQMCRELNAQAFTYGTDIYFNAGKYQPGTEVGQRLLAHELTHVVQQVGGITRKKEEEGEEDKGQLIDDHTYQGPLGTIVDDGSNKKVELSFIYMPKFKERFVKDEPSLTLRFGEERETKQRDLWDQHIRNDAGFIRKYEDKLDAAPNKFDDRDYYIYYLRLKGESRFYVIGNYYNVRDIVARPFWDKQGNGTNYEVDHQKEWQVQGEDSIENLWLLDVDSNKKSGEIVKRKRNLLEKLVQLAFEAGLWDELPGIDDIIEKYEITAKETKPPEDDISKQKTYTATEVKQGKTLSGLEVLNAREIAANNLAGRETELSIFFNKVGVEGSKRTGYGGKHVRIRNWDQQSGSKKELDLDLGTGLKITSIEYEPGEGGKIWGSAFFKQGRKKQMIKEWVYEVDILPSSLIEWGGYIEAEAWAKYLGEEKGHEAVELIGMSPIVLNRLYLDPLRGLVGQGKVKPTIPLINKNADIDIFIEGTSVRLEKQFSIADLWLPKPIELQESTLGVSVGTDGYSISGQLSFGIKGIGEGYLKGIASSKEGIGLAGQLDLDEELFGEASVQVEYQNGDFSVAGSFTTKKIPGLKKASGTISYDKVQGLAVAGEAVIGVHGGKEVVMALGFNEEGITFSGEVDLSQFFPKGLVEKGKLDLSFTKDSEGYSLSGTGSITPRIPGVKNNPTLTISYVGGALTVSGKGDFEIWKGGRLVAKGTGIEIGVTNQPQEGGDDPAGNAADTWRFFGGGEIELFLGDNISGKISVRLDAKTGRPIISGTVELVPGRDQEEDEKDAKDLFNVKFGHDFNFPLLTLPIGRISVFIKWWLRTYAKLYLPRLQKISLSVNNFDLAAIGDAEAPAAGGETVPQGALKADVEFFTKAKAGIEAGASIGIKGELLYIIEATAEICGNVALEGELTGIIKAGLTWVPGGGLTFGNLTVGLTGSAYFLATLDGKFRVYLDLWLTEIDILNESLPIGEAKFGTEQTLALGLTGKMGEENRPQFDPVDKNALKGLPDLSSTSAKGDLLKEAAGSKNSEFKDPEPPSLEKAISVVRQLPSGPIIRSLMKNLDKGKEAAKINEDIEEWNRQVEAAGWSHAKKEKLSRDTYLDWLSTRFPTLDWMPVYETSLNLDRRKIARFREISRYDQYPPASSQYQSAIRILARDHPILFLWHPEEIDPSGIYHGLSGFGGPEGYVSAQILDPAQNAEVKFLSVEVELDRYNGFQKGMWIHVSLETANLKEQLCELTAYFYYWNGSDWAVLRDYDDNYSTVDNQASVGKEFTPAYTNSRFPRITLFMPYKELHLAEGRFDLRFKLGVYPKKKNIFGNFLQYSSFYSFALVSG
jgi:hypothetical protein